MTVKFEVGKSYATRSACDHDTIYAYVIIRRTEKSVWIDHRGAIVQRKLITFDGVESFKPNGSYSMCAVIHADRTEDQVRGVKTVMPVAVNKLLADAVAAGFGGSFANDDQRKYHQRFFTDTIARMSDEDFAKLDEMRRYMRGE